MPQENEPERRFGVYTGIVANVDDPEQRGRVQLRISAILGQQAHPARALPMGARQGEGTGSPVVPERGASVLVMFLDGSPEVPLYTCRTPGRAGPRRCRATAVSRRRRTANRAAGSGRDRTAGAGGRSPSPNRATPPTTTQGGISRLSWSEAG